MKRLIIGLPYFIIGIVSIGLIFTSLNPDIPVASDADTPLILLDAGHGGYVLTLVA